MLFKIINPDGIDRDHSDPPIPGTKFIVEVETERESQGIWWVMLVLSHAYQRDEASLRREVEEEAARAAAPSTSSSSS